MADCNSMVPLASLAGVSTPHGRGGLTVSEAIGKRIRLRRRFLSMTQTELGNIIGVRFQQIQKYECGANTISASRLYDIAEALRIPITDLFPPQQLPSGCVITEVEDSRRRKPERA